jgi:hypothetical protein
MEQLGVIVNRSSASVSGAYAFDAAFFGHSKGGQAEERATCGNEPEHARGRVKLLTRMCASSSTPREIRNVLANHTQLNCRFSSLEAMAQQMREFARSESSFSDPCLIGFPRHRLMHNQVQLRYGADDIIGVVAKTSAHLPHTTMLKRWLSDMTGGKHLDSVLLTGASGAEAKACRCVEHDEEATRSMAMPVVPYEQPLQARRGTAAWQCPEAPDVPCPMACGAPPTNLLSPATTYHVSLLNIPHTGAGYAACAAADWERIGWWTNVGSAALEPRRPACNQPCRGGHRARVLVVRNPYSFWWSRYHTANACREGRARPAQTCAGVSALALRTNLSFPAFLYLDTKLSGVSQSESIQRLCGKPCMYDYVLRFESLHSDWIALLARLSFPLRPLPPEAGEASHILTDLSEHYTPELDHLIRGVEAFVFEHFRYPVGRIELAQ